MKCYIRGAMQGWASNSIRLFAGAFVLNACAGKSISRTDTDATSSDDGSGGSRPGAGGSIGTGARGGTEGRGGTAGVGKGGGGGTIAPTGGKSGVGGTAVVGGSGGVGGTNVAGDDSGGAAGDGNGCLPSRADYIAEGCTLVAGCISIDNPTNEHIARNAPAANGEGGEGGDWGTDPTFMEARRLCNAPDRDGFIAVDLYIPNPNFSPPGIMLFDNPGTFSCGGHLIGMSNFSDYALPPLGTWTTQCLAVTPLDFDDFMVAISARSSEQRVRNVRFVSSCDCPRRIRRYTTCGDVDSPRVCR